MHVSVEKTSELSRKMTVSFSEAEIQPKIEAQFKALTHKVKMDGFRPGKVPQPLLKKRYHAQVRHEVTTELVQNSYPEALKQENLEPVGQPQIHPLEQSEGFAYIAEFELAPVVVLDNLADIQATRFYAQVEDSDFEKMLLGLREQKRTWSVVERPSQIQDQITLHFSGTCDGENFTQGKVENYPVIIGSQQMIPGFEDQLLELEAGHSKSFEIVFPEKYNNAQLAGKTATFEIEVVKVEAPILPEINEEFVRQYGIEDGDLDDFYRNVRANMERELSHAIQAETKKSVLNAIYHHLNIPLPTVLVDQEINHIIQTVIENAQQQQIKPQDLDLPRHFFESQAKYRVALGFILNEIIHHAHLQLDQDRVRMTIEDLAQSYEYPEEMIRWHYEDRKRLEPIIQLVMENQAVDWIVSQIQMNDETLSFSEIMDRQQR